MFNAVHEALSHKGRFAFEYVIIHTPNCPVHEHKVLVGVAVVEHGETIHKMVHSQDIDFWLHIGEHSDVRMVFPSTLPEEQLNRWKRQCAEHGVQFDVAAVAFSESEQRCHQDIVERCTVVASKKRMAA